MSKLTIASPLEQRDRDALCAAAWGAGLTLEQFQTREQRLRAHPWAQKTLTSWLWTDDHGAVLSSCETFLDEASAGARVGTAATIASVFTESKRRGLGHAANMLRAVLERLRADPHCLAATLFFGGLFSHAVRKKPRANEWRVQHDYGGESAPYAPSTGEVSEATLLLQRSAPGTVYARVDAVEWEGRLHLMELEVVEPELFFRHSARAPALFADALGA